ncbi:MAG: caspase family protein [Clostridia bacterium]|nr:caspase family protein [Clostridia bacterium]
MRAVKAMLILLLLLLPVCAGAAAQTPVIRAVLIGCDTFVTMQNTAPSSENNVDNMAELLCGGTVMPEVLITRKNEIASTEAFAQLVSMAFAEAQPGDISCLYISTHGVRTESGGFGLMLSDGTAEALLTS